MNILCLEQFAGLGGGQLSLLSLLPSFVARGWRPVVAIPQEGALADRTRAIGLEVKTMHCASFANGHKSLTDIARFAVESPRLISAIARMISAYGIQLIYVNAPRLLPAAAVAARVRSVPLVFHCHNRLLERPGLIAAGQALRLSHAHVIACCKYAAAPIQPYVDGERLSVLYNGIERLVSTRRGFGQLRSVGVIGRIEAEKGQLDFVRAARIVLDKFPQCRFFVAGAPLFSKSDYFNEVVELSRNLPVTFLGWRDDIAAVFRNLDLLVVPSSQLDSAPRVIFEAFSSCVPVVAFPSGGIPEIITDGETGFLASTTDFQALADRICSILAMKRSDIGAVARRAWKRWKQEYTIERYQEQVAAVLMKTVRTYL